MEARSSMKSLLITNSPMPGNSRHGHSNTNKTSRAKLQNVRKRRKGLKFGTWNSYGTWSLVVGVFLTKCAQCSVAAAEEETAAHSANTHFDLITGLFVFMLATFVGLEVIRRVSRLLHTPLMSLTNAISAIAVVGAILVAGPEHPTFIHLLGLAAVAASVTNIVSGFLITDRMLKMFKKKGDHKPR